MRYAEEEKLEVILTKEAFYEYFNQLRANGVGLRMCYERIDLKCESHPCLNYYSSFQSFKSAYYAARKKNRGNMVDLPCQNLPVTL